MDINKKLETIFSQELEVPLSILCSTGDQDKVDLIKSIIPEEQKETEPAKGSVIYLVPHYRARHIVAYHLEKDSHKIIVAEDMTSSELEKIFNSIEIQKTTVVIFDTLLLNEDLFTTTMKTRWKHIVCILTILNPSSEGSRNLKEVDDVFNHPPW